MERARKAQIAEKIAFEIAKKELEDEVAKQPLDLGQLESLLKVFESVSNEFVQANQSVMKKMLDGKTTDEEYTNEVLEDKKFRREMQLLVDKVAKLLPKDDNSSSNGSGDGGTKRGCKLPKLELPKFSGGVREWMPFWSQFAKIHTDPQLQDVDKLSYLCQCMDKNSEPAEIVSGFMLISSNYQPVVDALQEKYGRDDLQVQVHVRDLMALVIKNIQAKQTMSISSLYVKLTAKLRALESLKVTKDKCAAMLYPLVESCLPEEVLRMWERNRGQLKINTSEEELEHLMRFLQSEVRGEDHIKLAKSGFAGDGDGAKQSSTKTKQKSGEGVITAAALLTGNSPEKEAKKTSCAFCEKGHPTQECRKASELSLQDKQEIIKKSRRCFSCFKFGHTSARCRSFVKCAVCGGRHYVVVCPELPNHQPYTREKGQDSVPAATSVTRNMCQVENPEVLLQTLWVKLHGPDREMKLRAVVDTGSQNSYILSHVAEMMKLKKLTEETSVHSLFGGTETKRVKHNKYCATFSDLDDSYRCEFIISDMPVIAKGIQKIQEGPWIRELQQYDVKLTDRGSGFPAVDVLFGADVAGKLLTGKKIELTCGPVAVETSLGWTLMGKLPIKKNANQAKNLMVVNLHVTDASIQELWSLDVIGIRDAAEHKTREELEQAAMAHFDRTVTQLADGRYEVQIPWIEGHPPLPNNKDLALARLRSTTQKLKTDGKLEAYHQVFVDWEQEGIIEKVREEDKEKKCLYLPHRAVYKPSSSTTPLRPVYDASAHPKGFPSINNCVEKGPNLLELIPDILTRFRMRRYGIIADIRKAFLQISIAEKDRDFLRFLWYQSPDGNQIQEYRHCRVVFGLSASPFLLAATLNHHLDRVEGEYTSAAQALKKSFYVDNLAISLSTEEGCRGFKVFATDALEAGKFELREWEFGFEKQDKDVPLLGLIWKPADDSIRCDLTSLRSTAHEKCTRRNILSSTHRVFDPLGFTCPFTIIAKMLVQKTWSLNVGWDAELPEDIRREFEKWVEQAEELADFRIPRWIAPDSDSTQNWQLHVFVDASQDAFGAVIYLRNDEHEEVTVNFVQARARVTPKKKVTIPRLELIACLVGARLSVAVLNALSIQLPVWYWTDSTVALAWIQREEIWNVFVNNRTQEIKRITDPTKWRHVPGQQNPADFPSRGATVKTLKEAIWCIGPEFLKKTPDQWPHAEQETDEDVVMVEKRKTVSSMLSQIRTDMTDILIRYSDYDKMVKIVAWILRIRKLGMKGVFSSGPMTVEDIEAAERSVIRILQQSAFTGVDDPVIAQLKPYTDEDGLIRVNTKILNLEDDELFKRPYILPSNNEIVTRMIRSYHLKNGHAGVSTLMVLLREKFWIVRARQQIKKVVRSCLRCSRYTQKRMDSIPPPLPRDRVEQCRPFEVVGVDLAGPLFLKNGEKTWIVLYTCAVYRAVHLELVTSLSTDAFIQSLRRFCSRRSRPRVVYSDNGTNFRGAYHLFARVDWKKVLEYATADRIKWRFSAATAAWWGGFWERMVGVVKGVLRRVLGKASLTYEELSTTLCEAEAMVNRRPLTYVSEENEDFAPLTPSMFLDDGPCGSLPEADVAEQQSLSKRYKYRQAVKKQLRDRFRKEYLSQLVHRTKAKEGRVVAVGDIVLVGQDNQKRLNWPLGKVLEVIPGCDGVIRTVKLKTGSGILVRPIQRLYALEVPKQEEKAETTPEVDVQKTRFGRVLKKPDRLSLLTMNVCCEM